MKRLIVLAILLSACGADEEESPSENPEGPEGLVSGKADTAFEEGDFYRTGGL